jgi:hypothetical protein
VLDACRLPPIAWSWILLWSRPCAVFNIARRLYSIRERQDGFCVCPMVPLHMCTPVSDQSPNSFLGDLRKSVITHALKPIYKVVSTIYLPGNPLAARAFSFHISLIGNSEKNKSFSYGPVVHIEVVFCEFFKVPAVSSLVALAVAGTRASRAASRRAAIGPWPRADPHRKLILCCTTAPCAPAMPKFSQATWR